MKLALLVLTFVVISGSTAHGWWFISSEPEIQPHEDISEECLRQANWGRCEFYACIERRFPCGSEGYATYIGLHFCNKMNRMLDSFTERGRQWLNGTSRCLTASLRPIYNSGVTTCSAIKDVGAEGLTSCNARVEDDGVDFCRFVRDNKDAYEEIFGTSDIGRMISMKKPGVVMTMFVNGARCGANRVMDRMTSAFGSVGDMFASWGHSMGRGWNRMVDWMHGRNE